MRDTANLFCEHGWDVTVVTLARSSWLREFGLDASLLDRVDPRISVMELPLVRADLEPDIRTYSWLRARYPRWWLKQRRERFDTLAFPEPVFGSMRWPLTRQITRIFRQRPADLVLVSPGPYTLLAPTWKLHKKFGVPIAVDYRDAWSLDVLAGEPAFPIASRRGRWERRVLERSAAIWCVNEPIAQFYRERYPSLADRVRVVRNGFDPEVAELVRKLPDPDGGLTFGYLGTINFSTRHMGALIAGWRLARQEDPTIAGSRLVFRGHIGVSVNRATSAHLHRIMLAQGDGVSYGGPVAKADIAKAYGEWDVLVLALAGGKYVTSGKVYEYMATGLPIMSAHEQEHAANEVLHDYPLWIPPVGVKPEDFAQSFSAAARVALAADEASRLSGARMANQFARRRQLEPAVAELADRLSGVVTGTQRAEDGRRPS
jgi:glycosyltransferase involved in cell wall biosynthesis